MTDRDDFARLLRERADVAIPEVAPAGALNLPQIMDTKEWFEERRDKGDSAPPGQTEGDSA